jgi:hypothetical protein
MKRNFTPGNGLFHKCRNAAFTAALLMFGSVTQLCHGATTGSPIGTWDFVMNGAENGVAFITFSSDYTFTGVQIIAPRKPTVLTSTPAEVTIGRYTGEPVGRTAETNAVVEPPSTNSTGSSKNVLYGFYAFEPPGSPLGGRWTYDAAGRVIGSWGEIGQRFDGAVTNTVTNSVSFAALVVPGKRMTMTGSSGVGTVTFQGVPFTPVPDISGGWYGQTTREGQKFYEFIDISVRTAGPFPSFTVTGDGPTYAFNGIALVSSQKRIAFHTTWTTPTNTTIARAVAGQFKPNASKGTMKGSEDPAMSVTLKIARRL